MRPALPAAWRDPACPHGPCTDLGLAVAAIRRCIACAMTAKTSVRTLRDNNSARAVRRWRLGGSGRADPAGTNRRCGRIAVASAPKIRSRRRRRRRYRAPGYRPERIIPGRRSAGKCDSWIPAAAAAAAAEKMSSRGAAPRSASPSAQEDGASAAATASAGRFSSREFEWHRRMEQRCRGE
jgi:hypothetical protein